MYVPAILYDRETIFLPLFPPLLITQVPRLPHPLVVFPKSANKTAHPLFPSFIHAFSLYHATANELIDGIALFTELRGETIMVGVLLRANICANP